MQVQSPQPLCRLSTDIPLLEGTPVDESPQHRAVLPERYVAQSHNTHISTASPEVGQRSSLSPSDSSHAQRSVATGTYYTGNVHAQHIGLAGFGVGRSEKQIRCELGRLYKLLQRLEKYQRYREKQPALTPAEVVARDAAERKEQENRKAQGLQQEKDKTVWPDFLEHAFWTALIRWPPMGRKKYMLEGTQRGRNELIQDSIYRDTGIRRDRKQVSSHLQVLKDKLIGVPAVLLYMATPKDVSKRRSTNTSARASYSSQLHGRQHAQRTESVTKSESSTSSPHILPHCGDPQSDLALGSGPDFDAVSSSFAVTGFKIIYEDDHQSMHYLAQTQSHSRLDSSDVVDLASWRHQYHEFDFLRSKTEDWMENGRKVLVGTASTDLMTELPPDADLTIVFDLHSRFDLSRYAYVECMTRFYNSGGNAVDPQFDHARHERKETRTTCEYRRDPQGSQGVLCVQFMTQPSVRHARKKSNLMHRNGESVKESLQRVIAIQDIYGIVANTGEVRRLTKVLWRFQQTNDSAEVGNIEWRSVRFANGQSAARERCCFEATFKTEDSEDTDIDHERTLAIPTPTHTDATPYYQTTQLPLDLAQTHISHHSYETAPHNAYLQAPLSVDVLESMQPDSDHLNTSVATTTTELSGESFAPSRTSGMASPNTQGNDFNFNGEHIAIGGDFEPVSNPLVYGGVLSQNTGLERLHAFAGLEHDELATMGLAVGEHGQLFPVDANNDLHHSTNLACYSAKPNWQDAHLVSHLENAAEQYRSCLNHDGRAQVAPNYGIAHGHDPYQQVGQRQDSVAGVFHNVNHAFWGLQGLQSTFQDDTGSGAVHRIEHMEDQIHGPDYGVPDLVERDQRGRGY
ncbi:TEA/ATTS domain family-domain-containing protein [Alternaria rosae]|uniref:TEA/ATTS domain family-domain-containing protein n=1 Tax=Alternaria rosae TaxID=1187941 RepID=UPI001E8EA601|nr:TEA/ATTS domain family-domain-containing protein [Alternaria rosae]KAH6852910.1 TEA/ATTS domain family-domain-containing protein [Alternaria rosae]